MGTNDRARFLDRLEEAVKTRETVADIDDALRRRTFEVLPAGGMANRTRAMLKVEDGCVNFCTYCIIPYARGPVRSLPMDKAAEQVRALRAQGYREIVVTGIEISSYGHDLKDGTTLIDLLERYRPRGRGDAHPARLARAAHGDAGILRAGDKAPDPLPALPSLDAVRLRCDAQAHEPPVRHRAVL